MFADLNAEQRMSAIAILKKVIEILPRQEFVCHCLSAIHIMDDTVDEIPLAAIGEEVKARLGSYYTYISMLIGTGAVSEEEAEKMTRQSRIECRVVWVNEMIQELKQLNNQEF